MSNKFKYKITAEKKELGYKITLEVFNMPSHLVGVRLRFAPNEAEENHNCAASRSIININGSNTYMPGISENYQKELVYSKASRVVETKTNTIRATERIDTQIKNWVAKHKEQGTWNKTQDEI